MDDPEKNRFHNPHEKNPFQFSQLFHSNTTAVLLSTACDRFNLNRIWFIIYRRYDL